MVKAMPDRFKAMSRAVPAFVGVREEVPGSRSPGSNLRPADYESCEVALSQMLAVARDCRRLDTDATAFQNRRSRYPAKRANPCQGES